MRSLRMALVTAAVCLQVAAQYGAPPPPDVLLVARFHTPLSYDAALAKLDAYYQEQVGRKLASALPKIAEGAHYDTWHDMWVFFASADGGLNVTMKRPTDAATARIAKGWILQIAGRSGGESPVFEELPPMRSVESNVSASRREVARVLEAQPSFRMLETREHAGLLVSAAPLARVLMERASVRGVHHVIATAETLPAARQLSTRLNAAITIPCICAAYSETAEIDAVVRRDAVEKSEDVNATTIQKIYMTHMDPQAIEDKLRSDPEMRRRLAAADGWFAIKYRVDKAYAKVNIRWTGLAGYSRETGKFENEQPVGALAVANVKAPVPAGAESTGRLKLGTLKPGAYRIAIEGEIAGSGVAIDHRDYWFDGKTFEEL
ncbi:MAG TPA: hypothetical protein VNV86_01475 [Candidatus Acidoferrum sp.]|nr:hypothetical protein [Candidatus Acidoferrum sp.]